MENTLAKFNPLCLALSAADRGAGDYCTQIAQAATTAVVTAVLASYGLPASLPTSTEVAELAQGDLTELAVQFMNDVGVPCDAMSASPTVSGQLKAAAGDLGVNAPDTQSDGSYDVCAQVASMMLGRLRDQLITSTESLVAQADGLPDFAGVPGFAMEPEPKGQLQPVQIDVYATGHVLATQTPLRCSFSVTSTDKGSDLRIRQRRRHRKIRPRHDRAVAWHSRSWTR